MIFINKDGSEGYSLGDILPAGAVRVNADSTLYTPPVIPTPAPVAPAPKVDLDLAAAMARLQASLAPSIATAKKTNAQTIAEIEPVLKKKYGLDFFGVTKK